MKRLPFIISVPHAGLEVPEEVAHISALSPEQIAEDGDEGAAQIYLLLAGRAEGFVSTSIARAFVDVNRAEDHLDTDGVVKTHTCWGVPIYHEGRSLEGELIASLLERHYRPYHNELVKRAREAVLGIDCHTMAATGPPVAPDQGARRSRVCVGNAGGLTCDAHWVAMLVACLEQTLDVEVAVNKPFSGGYITRTQPGGIPWIQLELSREAWCDLDRKRTGVVTALELFHLRLQRAGEI